MIAALISRTGNGAVSTDLPLQFPPYAGRFEIIVSEVIFFYKNQGALAGSVMIPTGERKKMACVSFGE